MPADSSRCHGPNDVISPTSSDDCPIPGFIARRVLSERIFFPTLASYVELEVGAFAGRS